MPTYLGIYVYCISTSTSWRKWINEPVSEC